MQYMSLAVIGVYYIFFIDYNETELEEAFSAIEQVSGTVHIVQSPSIVNLNFLRNLRYIRCISLKNYASLDYVSHE